MKLLEERILRDGRIYPGNILKVDCFLNHQIDVKLLNEMGKEFHRLFEKDDITRILTIEASGIGIACIAAQYFGVPVVFAKKSQTINISGDVYTSSVTSYTHRKTYTVMVAKEYIKPGDRVLLIDDFLAVGNALSGLIDIVHQAGAEVAGAGIAIEKGFQNGGDMLRSQGIHLESLAIVDSMTDDSITFREQ